VKYSFLTKGTWRSKREKGEEFPSLFLEKERGHTLAGKVEQGGREKKGNDAIGVQEGGIKEKYFAEKGGGRIFRPVKRHGFNHFAGSSKGGGGEERDSLPPLLGVSQKKGKKHLSKLFRVEKFRFLPE